MAVWFVSHCHTSSQREKYVTELQKYIDVDVFGYCGELTVSKKPDLIRPRYIDADFVDAHKTIDEPFRRFQARQIP